MSSPVLVAETTPEDVVPKGDYGRKCYRLPEFPISVRWPWRTWTSRRESWSEAIEPVAERVDGDLAELAGLDVSQARATKVGEQGRPVDLTGRLGHKGTSRDRQADLILTWPRPSLKMDSAGRLQELLVPLADRDGMNLESS